MDLFFEDNHFADNPKFEIADHKTSEELRNHLAKSYPTLPLQDQDVFSIEGSNINSGNFKVGNHYVKTITHNNDKDYVNQFPSLSESLNNKGIPCFSFVTNVDNEPISNLEFEGKKIFVFVQEYYDGSFFTGDLNELEQMIELIESLKDFKPDLKSSKTLSPYKNWEPEEILKNVLSAKSESSTIICDFFDDNRELILKAKDNVLEVKQKLKNKETQFCHIDLHPHNIMFRNGKIASLLDLESFQNIQPEVAYSFAFFKLARKCISKGHSIEEVKNIFKVKNLNFVEVADYATLEAFRRTLFILELAYVKKDTRWASDLKKQIYSLKEIPAIFG